LFPYSSSFHTLRCALWCGRRLASSFSLRSLR
jgi:hypothetical protein